MKLFTTLSFLSAIFIAGPLSPARAQQDDQTFKIKIKNFDCVMESYDTYFSAKSDPVTLYFNHCGQLTLNKAMIKSMSQNSLSQLPAGQDAEFENVLSVSKAQLACLHENWMQKSLMAINNRYYYVNFEICPQ